MTEGARQAIEQRPDDKEYWTVAPNGVPIQVYWSEMTHHQKELQVEAEQRTAFTQEFDSYS